MDKEKDYKIWQRLIINLIDPVFRIGLGIIACLFAVKGMTDWVIIMCTFFIASIISDKKS